MRRPEVVYPLVAAAARGLFGLLGLRVHVEGAEHVPTTGPVVLVATHVSYLDFALVGLVARRSRRRVRFLARYDVWAVPVVGALMTRMRHVPVDRAAPAAAYLRARSLLLEGEAVGIFPEAGVSTSYTVRALMPGAVALARATGAPIVPVAVWGPQRVLTAHRRADLTRGRPVSLLVGEPIHVDATGGRDRVCAQTAEVGARLQSLLSELQGRPEHQPRPGERAPWHPAHRGGSAPDPAAARAQESVPPSSVPVSWDPGRPAHGSWPEPTPARDEAEPPDAA